MANRIPVRFEGEGSGVEALSWGQLTIWEAMERQDTWMPLDVVKPLPAGTTIDDIAGELRFLMSRYQSMRTRLRFDADGPKQVVSDHGETTLEIVDTGDDEDPEAVARLVDQRLCDADFDFVTHWPVRMAVVRHRGVPTHQVMVFCHLATDGGGARVITADLAARDPKTGEAAGPPSRMQPLEQARWQRSPAGKRVSEAAIRYMDNLARTMPPRRWGNSTDPRQPRYRVLRFRSPAMHLALQAIAARTLVGPGPVLLACFLIAQARITGLNPAVTHVMASNRFRNGLAEAVCPLNQGALLMVDVAGITFDEAAERTRHRAMAAYKHAYYDPHRKTLIRWADQPEGMERRIGRERGEEIDVGCFLNDRRLTTLPDGAPERVPTPGQLQAALPRSGLTCQQQWDKPKEKLLIHVNDAPDTIDLEVDTDTHHIAPADPEAYLREAEAVAVQAAFDGTAPTSIAGRRS